MDLYFGNVTTEGTILLEDDEYRHLKVVRTKIGETIQVTDGNGKLFTAVISELNKNNIVAIIENTIIETPTLPTLHLAIAPTKNIDRIEWLIEKCVEAGIFKFSFIQCRHSERKDVKTERLKRIAISALKQSRKTILPQINEIIPFNNFMKTELEKQRLICTMEADSSKHIKYILASGMNTVILIGPEGDFHEEELTLARASGFLPTSLGTERLRTETAALAACIYFNFNKHD